MVTTERPRDPAQIIASFFRGNWDMPEKFATGLIEELASEGWIITRAQVFADILEALQELIADITGSAVLMDHITLARFERAVAASSKATEGQS